MIRGKKSLLRYITEDMGPVIEMPNPYAPWEVDEYVNPLVQEVHEIGSFETYCRGHFGWEWIEGLGQKLARRIVPVGKQSRIVPEPAVVYMENADIVRIEFSRMDRLHFYADAIIAAEIQLSGIEKGLPRRDAVGQWYRNRFIFEISSDGYSWEEDSVVIYDKNQSSPGLPLSEYLIPVLNEENMEIEAEEMLRRYYPEAFMKPMPIRAETLAGRMGLCIAEMPLNTGIMGQAVFYDGEISVQSENDVTTQYPVRPQSILVNSQRSMNRAQRNTTVVHECVHHHEHDLFVWAQTLYNEDICGIDCPVVVESFSEQKRSPTFWAEMQARLMTYHIKMNRVMTERKIQELSAQYDRNHVCIDPGRKYIWIINSLAAFFETSKEGARKRMLELGYEQVRGVMNYVNGAYLPPYFFSEGILSKNQTFVISLKDAAEEYGRNGRFRELVDSGYYVYVEGKFCVNRPEYVRRDRYGKYCMTPQARAHVEVCCLRFEYAYGDSNPKYAAGVFHMEDKVTTIRGQVVVAPRNAAELGLFSPDDFKRQIALVTEVRKAIAGMDFCEALCYLMKKQKCTIEDLEGTSLISRRTLSRLRNEPDYDVTWKHVVALAVGLHLPPAVSNDLLQKAGLALRNNAAHNAYGMIMSSCYTQDIYTVNGYLTAMGLEPLTEMAKAV